MKIRLMCAAALLLVAISAAAADFPGGPVRLTIGLPTGIVDIGSRSLAEILSVKWKQPVIVESKPGANEMLAADSVARAPKDGLTLLVGTESVLVNNSLVYRNPLINAQRDLVPLIALFEVPFALIVRSDLGVDSVADFAKLMKKDGKRYSYASSGVGSPLQLAMESFAHEAGFEMVHVPYKTLGQLQQDMMGGSLDAAFFGVNSALPFVKSGKLKMLAVTGAKRSSAAPQVPTFSELGFKKVDYETMVMLMAPRETPPATLTKITVDVREALRSKEFEDRFLRPQEVRADTLEGEALDHALATRRGTTKPLVEALNIKLD